MSLLFFDGFKDPGNMLKPEWVIGAAGVGGATGRDGEPNGAIAWGSDGYDLFYVLSTPAAVCVAGVAAYWLGPTTNAYILQLYDTAGTSQLCLMLNGSGQVQLRRNGPTGTLLGTGPTLASGGWHHYGIKAQLTTATTSTVYVYIDGLLAFTVTGVATSSTNSAVKQVSMMSKAPGSGARYYFDDFYVCDDVDATATQGRPNNDFLGDLRVATLIPTGAGDDTQWTPSTGGNWSTVDETPPNSTDYVSSSVSGQRDLYAMRDPTGTVATVYGVRTGYYASKSDAGPVAIKPSLKENAVVTTEAAGQAVPFGSWLSFFGQQRLIRPSDGGLWTPTDINNLQVGQEVA